jgi:Lon protease-like protein
MDLPVFALHTVLYPGQRLHLQVFEDRYLQMMEDVLPRGPFAIAAIRHGQEVGGPADPFRVGVSVTVEDYSFEEDGTYELDVVAGERITLISPVGTEPYAVWRTEPFPDEGGLSDDDLDAAIAAWARFIDVAGAMPEVEFIADDPVTASYALASAVPALIPERQAFLEIAGAGQRVRRARDALRKETALLRALRERRRT